MPAVSDIEGLRVKSPSGKTLGIVRYVLFHPSEPRAVGLQVELPAAAGLVDRKPRFVALTPNVLAACRAAEEGPLVWPAEKLPMSGTGATEVGLAWDDTVIWHHMPVRTRSGELVGTVGDAVFSGKTGQVLRVVLSEGAVADAAVGRTEVPGDLLVGFDGTSVVAEDALMGTSPTGGLAAVSGKGVAYAVHGAEVAADATLSAGIAGLEAVEHSFRSGLGKKAMNALRAARKRADRRIGEKDET